MQQSPFPMPPEQQPSSSIPQQQFPYPVPPQQLPPAPYPSLQGQPQPGYPPYPGQAGFPGYPLQPPQTQTRRNTALVYGLIFGAIIGVCDILETIINQLVSRSLIGHALITPGTLILYSYALLAVFTLINWGLYFCMGFLTARRTQRLDSASIAGLWAALCYLVVYCLILAFGLFSTLSLIKSNVGIYLATLLPGVAIAIVLNVGLGIGIATLGGVVGKSLKSK